MILDVVQVTRHLHCEICSTKLSILSVKNTLVYLLVMIGSHIRVRQETESSGDLGFAFSDIIAARLR